MMRLILSVAAALSLEGVAAGGLRVRHDRHSDQVSRRNAGGSRSIGLPIRRPSPAPPQTR